jgi:murein DD-endopeptidase MepM/ murein hydrolase activator NlpD
VALAKALTERFTDHHEFMVKLHLDRIDQLATTITELDADHASKRHARHSGRSRSAPSSTRRLSVRIRVGKTEKHRASPTPIRTPSSTGAASECPLDKTHYMSTEDGLTYSWDWRVFQPLATVADVNSVTHVTAPVTAGGICGTTRGLMKSTLLGHWAAQAPLLDVTRARDPRFTAGKRVTRVTAIVAALAVVVTATILGQATQSAFAADYPTWADVQAARNNVKTKDVQIAQLDTLLAGLQTAVTTTQAVADQKGSELEAAQQKFDESSFRAGELQKQADVAQAKAGKSKQQAGQLASRLARAGGSDLSARLFFNGGESKSLLSQLGLASMVKDQSAGLYEKATQDQNSAQSLTDQAVVAKDALKVLSDLAEKALAKAAAASEKAAAAVSEQQANKERLDAQRAVLVNNSTVAEADYNTGVQVRAAAAAAAAAAAKAKAEVDAKVAREYAAAHPSATRPAGNGGTSVSPSGWVRPVNGRISSPFGWRVNPYSGIEAMHAGIDLASSCGTPIVAANDGVVVFAGNGGASGNLIRLNNGEGISTAYAHIIGGGILVSIGQQVSAGQLIARVGSTGNSTGCHLHYEVRSSGTAMDPAPFMSARGATLG